MIARSITLRSAGYLKKGLYSNVAHVSFKQPIRAVLLDVDGTLYYHRPLRFFMALELCALPLTKRSFRSAYNTWLAIGHYRRV
jgi:hypothetical protein